MPVYRVETTPTFDAAFDRLDGATQKAIVKWVDKHLEGVDFPTASGKYLKNDLAGYVRFRIGDYRIIAEINDNAFIITQLYVGKRATLYRQAPKNR